MNMNHSRTIFLISGLVGLAGAGAFFFLPSTTEGESAAPIVAFDSRVFVTPAPYIPPQCYTKTRSDAEADGPTHNPCYVCHGAPERPNFVADADLQLEYSFPAPARENPWTNLFVDRGPAIEKVDDDEILSYVRKSNLFDNEGRNLLAERLNHLSPAWDANGNAKWDGFIPDAAFRFDEHGFDRDREGSPTGWRAYAYYPFPSTFWPTNGSAGDVLIRLPEPFRNSENGKLDLSVYQINLAILEALISRKDVQIQPTDERDFGVDLNRNGSIDLAQQVTFKWAPVKGDRMSYVGQAKVEFGDDPLKVAAGLFPLGTEILHTVRYLDVAETKVRMAARLKELRYAKKVSYRSYSELEMLAEAEAKEKQVAPDRLKRLKGDSERGLFNGQGWRYSGFIEDEIGDLRPQTREETAFCMGCHGGLSQTTDSTFSFSRKLPFGTKQKGWFHWSQFGLEGIFEPKDESGHYAYSRYLAENHSGNEFRSNAEVEGTFFGPDGTLKAEAENLLHEDVSRLLLPSSERALALNKAYREVVREQSYVRGRDTVLSPQKNVHRRVSEGQQTGIQNAILSASVTPKEVGL